MVAFKDQEYEIEEQKGKQTLFSANKSWSVEAGGPLLLSNLTSSPGRIFLTIDTMHKVEKSREGNFLKIPPSMNANLTAGNV